MAPRLVLLTEDDQGTLDDLAEAEEALPGSAAIMLMKDEIHRLDELIDLSQRVNRETKIECVLDMIAREFVEDEPVLLFTEYKATQTLMVNALHRRFDYDCSTFINGDERLDGLEQPTGDPITVARPRERCRGRFQRGPRPILGIH